MKKWEYLYLSYDAQSGAVRFISRMERDDIIGKTALPACRLLGEMGWELAASVVTPNLPNWVNLWFKREIPQPSGVIPVANL